MQSKFLLMKFIKLSPIRAIWRIEAKIRLPLLKPSKVRHIKKEQALVRIRSSVMCFKTAMFQRYEMISSQRTGGLKKE